MIIYKKAETDFDKLDFCNIAISNNLFISGWNLSCFLMSVINQYVPPSCIDIALAFEDDIPVGISFKDKDLNLIQCFVKPKYRNSGIGTELVSFFKCIKTRARLGTKESEYFWLKNKIIHTNH